MTLQFFISYSELVIVGEFALFSHIVCAFILFGFLLARKQLLIL